MTKPLRVGMIGVNAERGWAREAHAPAVIAVDGLELAAVATRRQDSADAAARRFDVPKAYGDADALIRDPEIDVVAVVSAVPTHRALILSALASGKHVLTEWPVAVGTRHTRELADAAAAAGLHATVGLQARTSPAALRARRLIADERIGRILAVRAFSTTAAFGGVVEREAAPLEDPSAGMHLTTIQAAHTVDLARFLAGDVEEVSALRSIRFPEISVTGSARLLPRTLPDRVLVQARLVGGAAASVEVIGGAPASRTPFRMEIEGDRGTITVEGGAPRGFQSGALTLSVDGVPVALELPDLPASVVSVAGLYATLRDDIAAGTHLAPSFDDALSLSGVIDAIVAADHSALRIAPTV